MALQKLEALPLWQLANYVDGFANNKGTAPIWGCRKVGEYYVEPPRIGERINVTMNGLGPAVVVGYAVEDGYLGVLVNLESPPEWHIKQNADSRLKGLPSLVFGPEIAPL